MVGDMLSHTLPSGGGSRSARLFMSPANVEALQGAIRYRVWVETRGVHVISPQSETELSVIMQAVLLQSGRNNDSEDVLCQVRELNAQVIAFCVPRIVSELNGYVRYRRDLSSMPQLMERGQLATSKGTRALEMPPPF
jgi:hypothetical protein